MTNPKRQIRDYYNCFKGTKLIIAKLKWMLLIVIYQKQRHNHANDKKRWKKSALFSTIQIANSVPETQSCIFPWFQSIHNQHTFAYKHIFPFSNQSMKSLLYPQRSNNPNVMKIATKTQEEEEATPAANSRSWEMTMKKADDVLWWWRKRKEYSVLFVQQNIL